MLVIQISTVQEYNLIVQNADKPELISVSGLLLRAGGEIRTRSLLGDFVTDFFTDGGKPRWKLESLRFDPVIWLAVK